MPIYVNEIVVRAVVVPDAADEKPPTDLNGFESEALIAECVDQVMEILKEKEER